MVKKCYQSKFLLISLSILLFIISVLFGISIGFSNFQENIKIDSLPALSFSYNTSGPDAYWTHSATPDYFSGSFKTEAGMCNDTASSGTLTIKNISNNTISSIKIVYNLSLSGGTCSFDGKNVSTDGENLEYNFSNLNPNDSVDITLKSSGNANSNNAATTIIISNIYCFYNSDTPISVQFLPSLNGKYFVDGMLIDSETFINEKLNTDLFTLEAVPDDGYNFLYRNVNGSALYDDSYITTYLNDGDVIYPVFVALDLGAFKVGSLITTDLEQALEVANSSEVYKIVEMIKTGSVDSNKTYVVGAGVTLFIPNKNNAQIYLDNNKMLTTNSQKPATPTLFRRLDLYGCTIQVENEGILYIGGEQFVAGANDCAKGLVSGSTINGYGQISLDSNSKILLNDGSKLYCYGYITGEGKVLANNGSEVNEIFQIGGFRGGSCTLAMNNNRQKVFPFNQYFIQNIESELYIYYGSTLKVHGALYASDMINSTEVIFVGANEGLFNLTEEGSYLTRVYDYKNDKVIYSLDGKALLSPISVKVASSSINSNSYDLPICNNFVININSNSEVTVNQNLCLLPGATINLASNSELRFSTDKYLIVYDNYYWENKNYAYGGDFHTVNYSASLEEKPSIRKKDNIADAELNINGTVYFNDNGCIYTTFDYDSDGQTILNGGANIHSTEGEGKVIFETGLGNQTTTYQVPDAKPTYDAINIGSVLLKNGDGSFFNTNLFKEEIIGKTIYFNKEKQNWEIIESSEMIKNITFVNEITKDEVVKQYKVSDEFTFPTASEVGFSSQFILKGWSIDNTYFFKPGETIRLNNMGNVRAYAVWGGWVKENEYEYYLDYTTGSKLTGLNKVENIENKNKVSIHLFDENGNFSSNYRGVYFDENTSSYYLIINGIVVDEPGFYKYEPEITANRDFEYVFIKNDSTILINDTYYVSTYNDYLPSGTYTFNENGYVVREDSTTKNSNGAVYIYKDETYIDGVKVSYGLFKNEGYFYYSNSDCKIVKNSTHYVSETNGLYEEGLYYFDDQGRMCDEKLQVIKAE